MTTTAKTPSLTDNPLLQRTEAGLPRFDAIEAQHVEPAIHELLAQAKAALDTVVAPAFKADWTALAATLDVATERLGLAWGAVSHLKSVAETPELRAAYNAVLPAVTEFWTQLGANQDLYAKYKAINANELNTEQSQALRNTLRSFALGRRRPAR